MPKVPYNSDSWIDISGQTNLQNNPVMSAIYYGQMQHETAIGSSELFLEYNNLFGMRPSTDRQQFYESVKVYEGDWGRSEYAIYVTPLQSLRDVLDRNDYFNINPVEEPEDALTFMMSVYNSAYFTDNPKNYIKAWLYHCREGYPTMKFPTDEEVDERLPSGFSFGGVTLGVVGIFLIVGLIFRKRIAKLLKM